MQILSPDLALPLGLIVGFIAAYLLTLSMDSVLKQAPSGRAPQCNHKASTLSRIPVLGYLLLRGRCADCGKQLSGQVFLYEGLVILLCLWAFMVLPPLKAIQATLLIVATVGITLLDIRHWIIANQYVALFIVLALFDVIMAGGRFYNLVTGLGVGAVVSMFLLLPQVLDKETTEYSFGDVKLVLALSLWLGWVLAIYGFFIASVLAFLTWLISGFIQGFSVKRRLPFGPFIALSALVFGMGKLLDPQFVNHVLSFRF